MVPGLELPPAGGSHWLGESIAILRTNHRSHPQIREAAAAVNRQEPELLERLPPLPGPGNPAVWTSAAREGGCWWWEQKHGTTAELRLMLQRWAEHTYLEPLAEGGTFLELLTAAPASATNLDDPAIRNWLTSLFAALERTRLLTLVRDGPWGCDQINDFLEKWLRRRSQDLESRKFIPGLPVLITRNDRARDIFNGDVGLTIAPKSSEPMVVFARHDRFLGYVPESLPPHELGFALTVHKSQGSEYAQTLLMVPPAGGRRLLSKELVYTALTRAKHLAVVCSTAAAFREAISRRIVRESGLGH
jgi:exodeoxyribonuclease V alpha subunit